MVEGVEKEWKQSKECRSKHHDDESSDSSNLIMTKMMTKSPKNDFKIQSTNSRSSLISSFMRRNQEDSKIKRSLIPRFKRR